MKLLSEPKSNPKIAKNIDFGVMTAPLHLAPYDLSGFQVCPMASKGCAAACLNTAGRGHMTPVQEARKRKTIMFFNQRSEFMEQLVKDVAAIEAKARLNNLKCGIRLNATSDIPWESIPCFHNGINYTNIMRAFPSIQFYDYTKRHNRKNLPENSHLTYSLAEDNDFRAVQAFENGMNIAVVFKDVPDYFKLGKHTIRVINGDEHDYRPIDPKGVIVGLKAKGRAKYDKTGFVR